MDDKKQNLSPDLKQIYDRVMNTSTAKPGAPAPMATPINAAPIAPQPAPQSPIGAPTFNPVPNQAVANPVQATLGQTLTPTPTPGNGIVPPSSPVPPAVVGTVLPPSSPVNPPATPAPPQPTATAPGIQTPPAPSTGTPLSSSALPPRPATPAGKTFSFSKGQAPQAAAAAPGAQPKTGKKLSNKIIAGLVVVLVIVWTVFWARFFHLF